MAKFLDAEPSYEQPSGPRRSRDHREAIRHQHDPEWRPELDGDPSNLWMVEDLAELDRAVLTALTDDEGPLTLMALEIAVAPAAAADRAPREDIRGAACMLDALHFANITDWDNRGIPSVFEATDQGREARALLDAE